MRKLRYFLSNINLINIVLTVALIFFVFYMILPFLNIEVHYTLPVVKKHTNNNTVNAKKLVEKSSLFISDYIIIAEQNIFHPERKILEKEKDASPIQKPHFVLYGSLITDNINLAYLDDLKSQYCTPSSGKRQRTLHLGDILSGYALREIYHDRIVMARGDDRIVVTIIDQSKQKREQREKILKNSNTRTIKKVL